MHCQVGHFSTQNKGSSNSSDRLNVVVGSWTKANTKCREWDFWLWHNKAGKLNDGNLLSKFLGIRLGFTTRKIDCWCSNDVDCVQRFNFTAERVRYFTIRLRSSRFVTWRKCVGIWNLEFWILGWWLYRCRGRDVPLHRTSELECCFMLRCTGCNYSDLILLAVSQKGKMIVSIE